MSKKSTETSDALREYLNRDEALKAEYQQMTADKNQTEARLLQNYNQQVNDLQRQKQSRLRAADVSYRKLLKYLPEYQNAMGLYGNGLSETALLEATAQHRSQIGAIESEHQTERSNLLKEYQTKTESNEQNYDNRLLNLYTTAKNREEESQNSTYQAIREGILSGAYSSGSLLQRMKELKNEDGSVTDVTPRQYRELSALTQSALGENMLSDMENYVGEASDFANAYGKYFSTESDAFSETVGDRYSELKSEYDKKYAELQQSGADQISSASDSQDLKITNRPNDLKAGSNLTVELQGEKYRVELADSGIAAANNSAVYRAASAAGIQTGEVFLWQGEAYYQFDENTICSLRQRKNTYRDHHDQTGQLTAAGDYTRLKNVLKR